VGVSGRMRVPYSTKKKSRQKKREIKKNTKTDKQKDQGKNQKDDETRQVPHSEKREQKKHAFLGTKRKGKKAVIVVMVVVIVNSFNFFLRAEGVLGSVLYMSHLAAMCIYDDAKKKIGEERICRRKKEMMRS
jgi:hypothetical protein